MKHHYKGTTTEELYRVTNASSNMEFDYPAAEYRYQKIIFHLQYVLLGGTFLNLDTQNLALYLYYTKMSVTILTSQLSQMKSG